MVRRVNSSTVFRLVLVGLAAASFAGCAKKPKMATQVPSGPTQQQPPPRTELPPSQGPVGQSNMGALPGSAQDFVVNVGDRVYFDTDSYDIRADAQPLLDAQANWLRRYGSVQVRIEGNADERGSAEYNLALGQKRAQAVVNAMRIYGVKDGQMEPVSYGEERPKGSSHDEAGWAKNRRADLAYRA